MSDLQSKALAVLISDLHISEKVPACRAESPSEWLDVQEDYFRQVEDLAHDQGDVPVVCAGDVFDRWDSPASLINWAIRVLPKMYAVPGQHDMPNHSYDQLHRSAYWTLVEAGVVCNLPPEEGLPANPDLILYGFPWGSKLRLQPGVSFTVQATAIHLAVVHKYLWYAEAKHPGANPADHVMQIWPNLIWYDAIVSGDNHRSFQHAQLFNPGTFIRRKADEISSLPTIGVLNSDGCIVTTHLDVSKDRFVEAPEKAEAMGLNSREFLDYLLKLSDAPLNFAKAVDRYLKEHSVDERTQALIARILEESHAES